MAGSSAWRWWKTWFIAVSKSPWSRCSIRYCRRSIQEHARVVEAHLKRHGVHLALSDGVSAFKQAANGAIDVQTKSGKSYPADVVILALGVRPETTLAKTAGLEIGQRGGIRVDEQMRTSNPDIFAVGDAVEVKDFVTGEWSLIALAGPANRQGRIAADVIAGRRFAFPGYTGHCHRRVVRSGDCLDWRQRESAEAARRYGLRKDLPLPEFARGLLPGCQAHRDEGHLPEVQRSPSRGAGARRGRGRQAHQRPRRL